MRHKRHSSQKSTAIAVSLTALVFLAIGGGVWVVATQGQGLTLHTILATPTLDTTNRQTLADSLKRMEASLGEQDQKRFKAAISLKLLGPASPGTARQPSKLSKRATLPSNASIQTAGIYLGRRGPQEVANAHG